MAAADEVLPGRSGEERGEGGAPKGKQRKPRASKPKPAVNPAAENLSFELEVLRAIEVDEEASAAEVAEACAADLDLTQRFLDSMLARGVVRESRISTPPGQPRFAWYAVEGDDRSRILRALRRAGGATPSWLAEEACVAYRRAADLLSQMARAGAVVATDEAVEGETVYELAPAKVEPAPARERPAPIEWTSPAVGAAAAPADEPEALTVKELEALSVIGRLASTGEREALALTSGRSPGVPSSAIPRGLKRAAESLRQKGLLRHDGVKTGWQLTAEGEGRYRALLGGETAPAVTAEKLEQTAALVAGIEEALSEPPAEQPGPDGSVVDAQVEGCSGGCEGGWIVLGGGLGGSRCQACNALPAGEAAPVSVVETTPPATAVEATLTVADQTVLDALEGMPALSLDELVAATGLQRSTMNGRLAYLVEMGRVHHVTPAEQGAALFALGPAPLDAPIAPEASPEIVVADIDGLAAWLETEEGRKAVPHRLAPAAGRAVAKVVAGEQRSLEWLAKHGDELVSLLEGAGYKANSARTYASNVSRGARVRLGGTPKPPKVEASPPSVASDIEREGIARELLGLHDKLGGLVTQVHDLQREICRIENLVRGAR